MIAAHKPCPGVTPDAMPTVSPALRSLKKSALR